MKNLLQAGKQKTPDAPGFLLAVSCAQQ